MNPQPLSCFLSTFLALTFPDVTTLLKFNITDWFWLLTLCKRFHSVYIHLCLISLTQYDLCELMRSSTAVTFHWCVFFMLIVNFCKWILMWSHHTRSKLCAFYQSFLSRKGNFLPFSQFLVYLCMLFSYRCTLVSCAKNLREMNVSILIWIVQDTQVNLIS